MKTTAITLCALSIAACTVGEVSNDTSTDPQTDPMTGDQFRDLSNACGADAQACAADCLAGVDAAAAQQAAADCAAAVEECLGGDPLAAGDCADLPECDGSGAGVDGVADCLAGCGDDFDACAPTDAGGGADLEELLECVQGAGGCLGDCAADVAACAIPDLGCDVADLADCLDGDPAALLECVQDILDGCSIPTDIDLTCFEGGLDCVEVCVPDLADCLAP